MFFLAGPGALYEPKCCLMFQLDTACPSDLGSSMGRLVHAGPMHPL